MNYEDICLKNGNWFEMTFGFEEKPYKIYDNIREFLKVSNFYDRGSSSESLTFNGISAGKFKLHSIDELRKMVGMISPSSSTSDTIGRRGHPEKKERIYTIRKVNKNISTKFERNILWGNLYRDKNFSSGVFQVSSTMNCINLFSPAMIPESGITAQIYDETQASISSLAAPAGTAYRTYFMDAHLSPKEKVGQTQYRQIDCSEDVHTFLVERSPFALRGGKRLWKVKNGYIDFEDLEMLNLTDRIIKSLSKREYDSLVSKVKVGISWEVDITASPFEPKVVSNVSQVFCPAVSREYSTNLRFFEKKWEEFAKIFLKASYEATILAGIIVSRAKRKLTPIFLARIGTEIFGNKGRWISDSLRYSLEKMEEKGEEREKIVIYFV